MIVPPVSGGDYQVLIVGTAHEAVVKLESGDLVFASNVSSTGSEVDLVILRPQPKPPPR